MVLAAQQGQFRYVYDDAGRLTRVIDSSGNEIYYTYDPVGNLLQITRRASAASNSLSIIAFTPQSGNGGSTVTLQGQNFSTTVSSNIVSFNGVASTVVSATSTSIVATVPTTATTGPITVTVGANTATSATNFTVAATPSIQTITPRSVVSGAAPVNIPNLQITGVNLTGSTFSFAPAFVPAAITVNSATIDPTGTSATLNVTVAANASGTYTLLATNASGASSVIATSTNSLRVLSPGNDDDGDGLTNAVEAALGTDPLNPTTSGTGLPDGWQVFYGFNPLDPTVASQDPDHSGLTVLQDFQQGLSPRNPNRVPPAVSQVTPKNGATAVTINGSVVVRFAEPLQTGTTLAAAQAAITASLGANLTLSASAQSTAAQNLQAYMNRTCCGNSVVQGTVTLTGQYGQVAGSVTPSSDGLSAVFGPSTPLSANTIYTVLAQGVRDAAGNLMTVPFTSSFTTGTIFDGIPPVVQVVDPENGLANIPTNAHYEIEFNKVMDPSTLTPASVSMYDRNSNLYIAGTVQVDATGMTASFVPSMPLPVAHNFVVSISTAIKDINGNFLASAASYSFSTGLSPETTPPHLVITSPASGATGVALNAVIDLEFSEPVAVPSIVPNVQITSGGQPVAFMAAASNGDERVTLTPASPLQPGATYTVTIGGGVTDLAAMGLDNSGSFTFHTGSAADTGTFAEIAVDPSNTLTNVPVNTLVRLLFNKPVDGAAFTTANLLLYPRSVGGAEAVKGKLAFSADRSSVTMSPASPLLQETQYCVYVYGVIDQQGIGLAQNGQNLSCFTTGINVAASAPTVVAVTPTAGASGMPVNTSIQAQLSGPISAVSASSGGITLSAGGIAFPGIVTANSNATIVTFTPQGLLAVNTTYIVTVGGFTDLAGNTVRPFTSTFSTTASALTMNVNVSTGLDSNGHLIATGGAPDGHWVVTPTSTTPPPGTFFVGGTSQPVLVAASGAAGYSSIWPANGPDSTWVAINPNSAAGNTFGVYSTTFNVPAASVPANLCLVGAMGVDDNGQLGINGRAIMPNVSAFRSLYPLNLPISSYLVPGTNTLSLGWGSTDNYYEAFRLQAVIENCGGTDTTGSLTVLSITPANGSTGVSPTAPVVVTFNEAVNPLSVNPSSVSVRAYGTAVAGSYAVDGATVTFTPLSPLPGSTQISVLVDNYAAVQDLVGNNGGGAVSYFTTAAAVDTTAPKVVAVTPTSESTEIGSNGQVVLSFSKSMNPATLLACCTTGNYSNVELLAGESRLGFAATMSADNRMLTLSNLSLPPSTVITVVATHGATDLSGNALADFTSQFTTGPAISTGHASVVNQRPADGASGISINATPIVLFVNAPLNASTVPGALHVAQNGQPVAGSVQVTGGGQSIEFTPSSPFAYGAFVQVFLDTTAQDLSGNAVYAYQASFTTSSDPASTAPALVNYSPAYGASDIPTNTLINFEFSEKLDPATINGNFLGNLPGKTTLDSTGKILRLTPSAPLTANQQFCFYVQGVKGLNGLPIPYSLTCFTTGAATQLSAPAVTSISPADKLSGVPVNARVSILFSGPIDPTSVNSTSLVLSGGGQTFVPASIGLANSNQTIELTPESSLPPSTVMTLTLSGLTDVAGNAVAAYTTHFTTGSTPALASPYVIAENPEYQATGVPLNSFISLNATAQLDPTTINSNSFYVQDPVLNKEIPGTLSLSTDALTAYFVPSTSLPASRQINVYFSGRGITDLAGNLVSCCSGNTLGNFYFTTGTAASTSAPHLVAISPSNGLKQVPTNAQVVATFNEPVNVESLGQITLTGGGGNVSFTSALSGGNQTLTITPSAALFPATVYNLTVAGVTDLSGNRIATFTSSFSTALDPDFVQPTVALFDPANGLSSVPVNTEVRLRFNKPIDAALFGTGSVMLYPRSVGGNLFLTGKVTLSSDAMSAIMTPSQLLLEETPYCIYLAGIVDDEGQGLAQNGETPGCFTTGTAAANAAPAVVGVSPAAGAINVPVQALVELQLNTQISSVSATAASLTVKAGGTAVPGAVVANSPTTVLFIPTSPLAAGTAYTVEASGFTDLAGNAVTPFSSQFTTSSSAASSGPLQVNSITPINGSTGVAVTAPVQIVFNEPVNPLSVNDLSVNVRSQGVTLAGTYATNGATVTFTPLNPMPGASAISVYVDYYGSVVDLSGNAGQVAAVSFTTAPTSDTTVPRVLSVTPANGASGIGLNGQVVLSFSKSMNPGTLLACCTTGNYNNVELLAGDTRLGFSPSISADNRTLTLSSLSLPASQVITVVVTHGATDLSGNPLVDFTSQFTTGAAIDTTHASVVAQRPGNGATGVSINASPVVLFLNKPLSPGTVAGAVHVSQNGQVVPGTVAVVGNGQTVDFTPASPWEYGSFVEPFLDASASDKSGLTVNAFHGTFTTIGDPLATAPTLVSYSPFSGATNAPTNALIEFEFDEKIDAASLSSASFGGVVGTISLDPTGYIVRVTPAAPLDPAQNYCVYTNGEKGVNGLAVPFEETCFKTGPGPQTVAPSVASVSPTDKLTGVPINAHISILFSGPIDTITATGATIQLSGGGQSFIPSSVSFTDNQILYSDSHQLVSITPYAPLPPNTVMTLTISGVKDVAGNPVPVQITHFTTGGSPALVTPYVVAENPEYQATGVPLNAFISLHATAEIDPSTVNSNSFYVYDTVLGQQVTGTYSLSTDALTAYFVPSASFAASRQYNVYFQGRGITDLAGNLLTCCNTGTLGNFYFTTGTTTSIKSPQITTVSPVNGFKQVPTNAQVFVLFNEPVDVQTLNQINLTGGGNTVPLASALSGGNQTLTLTPSITLAPGTTYTLNIAGVADLAGNQLKSPFASSFTTASDPDFTQPTVISVTPANGATTVSSNTAVQVQFSKPMDAISLSIGTFTVSLNGNTLVPGTVSVDLTGTLATFVPSTPLSLSASYTVRLSSGITDLEGQSIYAVQTGFTTGTQ